MMHLSNNFYRKKNSLIN